MKSGSRETEPAEPVPFSQSETVDGVVIKVEADAGVFPPDAVLSVSRVSDAVQEAAEEAVEEVLDEGRNLGLSYTFDIKILDADGEELQPEDGDLVRVSFALERVSDPNLEAAVYHVTEAEEGNTRSELIAEELDVRVDEVNEIITAESDGFSNYSVVFTYDDMGYEFRNVGYGGNYTEDIRDIVSVCGLTGEIQHASVSDDNYLTVSHLNGNWSITVKEFFWSTQTLTVTIGGVDYDINLIAVPDGAEIPYIDEEGYLKNCFVYEVYDGALNIPGGWWAITGQSPSDINNRVVIDGDVHLIVADDLTVSFNEGIHVREGSTLTIYGQIRQNGTLCATGSKNGAGIGGSENALGGRIIIYGATVKATGGKKGSLAVTKSPYPQQLSAGGFMGQGGNVTITGGVTLTAAGEGGRAVGAGAHSQFDNDLYIADGMIVIAGSGFESRMRVPADERVSSCREHIYAEIRPGPVNVKFEVFGKCAAPPDQEVFPEYRIERPVDPAADGCVFGGWYTEAECIHPYDFDEYLAGGTYTDMTLYARWISGCELSVETIWPDEDNNVIWENAAEMEFLTSTSSPKWERSFAAIPIDESFDINDYRVREWVRHTTSNIEPTYAKTYFEDTDGVDSSQGSPGKVLLIPADEDYVADRSYDFYAKIGSYKTGSLVYDTASFEASYSRDQDGNFIITNTQRG